MCKKGGFRCASHLSEKIEKLEAVEDRSVDEDAELRDAKYAYYGTPTGQKNLDKKIQRAEDNKDAESASHLHRVKTISSMLRQEEARQHKEKSDAQAAKEAKKAEAKAEKDRETVSNVLPADFNMDTAKPEDFDGQLQETAMELDKKQTEFGRYFAKVRRKYDKRVRYQDENGRWQEKWEKEDKEVAQALKEDDSPEGEEMRKEYNEHVKGIRDHQKAVDAMSEKFNERGGWNRAYLAAGDNGHVHKSKDCSTCNKGESPTQFDWKTGYSGADEDKIVKDAGYRACTVCYPSAPVGDRNSLPTKMYSQEEIDKHEARIEREKASAEKKAKAISNAPTLTGEPLKVGGETFKTERTATTAYNDNTMDYNLYTAWKKEGTFHGNDNFYTKQREISYGIVKSMAEKRDISIKELQEEMRPKVEAKIKKHNRDRLKEPDFVKMNPSMAREWTPLPEVEYKADNYDLSDEKYNTSPRNW